MRGVEIVTLSNITVAQIGESLLAIPGFIPVTVCTGYLAGWMTNLHGFRSRSMIERFFWSLPLSLSVSTILSVLIGKFLSLAACALLFLLCTVLFLAVVSLEWIKARRGGRRLPIGWHPLGNLALICALAWIVVAVFSLVDFQEGQRLFLNLAFYDHGARVNWMQSLLRTGVPPDNPLYRYGHSAHLRYYYFWLVDCAAVAKLWHLSARAVMTASCIWSGFGFAALVGLYLKHFLAVGARLRSQFILAVSLVPVSGLFVLVAFWKIVFLHKAPPSDGWSSAIQIPDWPSILFFYPHHLASLVCTMLAFLLAWLAARGNAGTRVQSAALIAAALASAFGLSVYVTCAFFFVVVAWAIWSFASEREWQATAVLASGGAGALLLLIPYLLELRSSQSKMHGGSVLELAVRPTISTHWLSTLPFVGHIATRYPEASENAARTILLLPASVIEQGFFLLVLAIFAFPKLRRHNQLTAPQRTLVVLIIATLPVMSFIRSGVLSVNDFGIHSAMFLQFPLLLLASELLMSWRLQKTNPSDPNLARSLPQPAAGWLRSLAVLAIACGVIGTSYRVLVMRLLLPISEAQAKAARGPAAAELSHVAELSHKAFFSYSGYEHLNASIPADAIVQFNASDPWIFWKNVDLVNVNHQVAIAANELWCGSEFGGDPSGCPAMSSAIASLFEGATADQARSTCRAYGVQYLVANVYDPAWQDKQGWVWNLPPVVADPEFRALSCRDNKPMEENAK